MTDRALVAVSADDGWDCGVTRWFDDRHEPTDGWRTDGATLDSASSFREVVETMDFARFDGVYRLTDDTWTAFLACWFGVEPVLGVALDDPRGDGAIVAVRSARDAAALRRWFRAAKATVAESVRAGDLSGDDAKRRLATGLVRRAGNRETVLGRGLRA
ncbi:MAG: DUF6735 family protein [Halorhabdus sp.]